MLAEPMPDSFKLIVERNPWKRLIRWIAWVFSLLTAGCIALSVVYALEANGADRREDTDAEEAAAVVFGAAAAGLLVAVLVLAGIAWAMHRYRTTIARDYSGKTTV